MFDLPLLLAWSGSDPAAGCANRSCQSTAQGCADPHRVFLESGPSVAPQHEICTSEKGPRSRTQPPQETRARTQCRRSGRRYSHWFAREVVSNLALVAEVGRTADTGSLTLRWREMDSKFQFRDASPPPTAWAPSFRPVGGGGPGRG